jgi:hypothetical protein
MTQADIDALDDEHLDYMCLVCKGMSHDQIREHAKRKLDQLEAADSTAASAISGYDALASMLQAEMQQTAPSQIRKRSKRRYGSDDEDDDDYHPDSQPASYKPVAKARAPAKARAKPKPKAKKPLKRQPYSRERAAASPKPTEAAHNPTKATPVARQPTALANQPRLSSACLRRLERLGQLDDPLLKLYGHTTQPSNSTISPSIRANLPPPRRRQPAPRVSDPRRVLVPPAGSARGPAPLHGGVRPTLPPPANGGHRVPPPPGHRAPPTVGHNAPPPPPRQRPRSHPLPPATSQARPFDPRIAGRPHNPHIPGPPAARRSSTSSISSLSESVDSPDVLATRGVSALDPRQRSAPVPSRGGPQRPPPMMAGRDPRLNHAHGTKRQPPQATAARPMVAGTVPPPPPPKRR